VIGHALTVRPTPETRAVWDRWIGIGFAIGSLCFFVGPFPGVINLVGAKADAIIFFVGSIFFTVAAGLEVREGTLRIGRRWAADASWSTSTPSTPSTRTSRAVRRTSLCSRRI
jgi:hypothetical protein